MDGSPAVDGRTVEVEPSTALGVDGQQRLVLLMSNGLERLLKGRSVDLCADPSVYADGEAEGDK